MIENFTKAMTGMYVLGLALGPTSASEKCANAMAMILVGQYDFELKCAFYFQQLRKSAETEAELEQPEVLRVLEQVKRDIRAVVQAIINAAAREDELQANQKKAAVVAKIADAEKPHELGTVAEIAAKYGISKSEVRRMKAAGTLHTLEKP